MLERSTTIMMKSAACRVGVRRVGRGRRRGGGCRRLCSWGNRHELRGHDLPGAAVYAELEVACRQIANRPACPSMALTSTETTSTEDLKG